MAGYDAETMEIVRRLQAARMDVVVKQPFFGVLLMNLRISNRFISKSLYPISLNPQTFS